MRIRIQAANGIPSRFKIWDDETGEKIGLVQSVTLKVSVTGATFQFNRFDPADYTANGSDAKLIASPVLKGKFYPDVSPVGAEFVFED